MDQNDADLLSLLATDLDRDFRQLVLCYQQRLYSFALRLAGSPHDAEDIVQEAFLRAYHALKSYPALKVRALRLRPWLYAITLNIFRDRKRKPEYLSISLDTSEESPMLDIVDQALGPAEEAYWHEWRAELERHVATLPERYRVAITLYYFEDLSYVEMAALLNQPVGTVKANVHRATRRLHNILAAQKNGVS